ncbi:phosphatase PAP2-related protein [Parasediminibacterium sp. JCM 36343]|uniref:phosphatase PAP2-related protein n=1 Tax=Parasediminibacterium sp. JCM 36343 TaxID=3374279 RepID=UPI00397D6227
MNEPAYNLSWKIASRHPLFIVMLGVGLVANSFTLMKLPSFFQVLQNRQGVVLNDIVLERLPSVNLSIPIFVIIWCSAILTIVRCLQNPYIFILFVWSFLLLTWSRLLTLTYIPLDPPRNLVQLKDPLTNTFYGNLVVTKDLFYSGHTATQFLMFLCLQKQWDFIFALFCTISIGIMVLVQHVHYTVDVLAAPLFTYIIFITARFIVKKGLRALQQDNSTL